MTFKKIVNEVYARKIKTGWILPILMGEIKKEEEIKFIFDLARKVICDKEGDDISLDEICFEEEFPKVKDYLLKVVSSINQKKS
ncbi:MAG: hypothetical protein V3U78_09990 [Thiotrichaceae bacterium]